MGKRILMTTTGSLGDLHPFMAIGLELQARGHAVTLATANFYRTKVEQAGLRFAPMGPHLGLEVSEVMDRIMDLRKGPEYLIRQLLYPGISGAYAEVMEIIRDADLMVTHPVTFAAQIAAEKTGMPWVSTVTAPMSFFSKCDRSVISPYPFLARLRTFAPALYDVVLKLGRIQTNTWRKPIVRFRASLGMSPGLDPLFEGQHSPQRVLAMFSPLIAQQQADWPPQTLTTGFPFYDQAEHGQGMDPALERFLDSGPPPVVFTLGSSAVHRPGSFYFESLAATRRLGCRAVLLGGSNSLQDSLPEGAIAIRYAPFSQIFPRAAVIVHQGGIGTCGQAMAAGRPMLVVPFAFDQPDNAARLQRMGVARVLARGDYSGQTAYVELERLLSDTSYAAKAVAVARRLAEENGVRAASDAIENHTRPL